jgi:hypothetical protein
MTRLILTTDDSGAGSLRQAGLAEDVKLPTSLVLAFAFWMGNHAGGCAGATGSKI